MGIFSHPELLIKIDACVLHKYLIKMFFRYAVYGSRDSSNSAAFVAPFLMRSLSLSALFPDSSAPVADCFRPFSPVLLRSELRSGRVSSDK